MALTENYDYGSSDDDEVKSSLTYCERKKRVRVKRQKTYAKSELRVYGGCLGS